MTEANDDQWIRIQEATFRNWCNENLKAGGRKVNNILTDMCDGVCLVALVEALQFRKIGKVYTNPSSKIHKLQNVSLALDAITSDNVRLVNVGGDDIVNGNSRIILGLIWSLVQRYQISGKKSKVPPKRLMTTYFRSLIPDLDITNFTSDWNDGVALHALLEHLKPGVSPDWKKINRNDRVENCRRAMVLAKDHFNIPRVIGPEHFADPALDEISSMTYLSYFVRVESPGYYHTLNWACKQLRTTNITNLTTDWNDGMYLCNIVVSLGGHVDGWPNLDRAQKVDNCQKGIDGAKALGVEPLLTAKELADPNVDHLTIMTYLSKFRAIQPRKSKEDKLQIKFNFDNVKTGSQTEFQILKADSDVVDDKVKVELHGPSGQIPCSVQWAKRTAGCIFVPTDTGNYKLTVKYDGTIVRGCPIDFSVKGDHSKVKLLTTSQSVRMGDKCDVKVDLSGSGRGEVIMESTSPTGDLRYLTSVRDDAIVSASLHPKEVGTWVVHVYFGEEEVRGSPINIRVSDPQKAWLSGPDDASVGEIITYRGSPGRVSVHDPGLVSVSGDGIVRGTKGEEAIFTVNASDIGGNITVNIDANGQNVPSTWNQLGQDVYEFRYRPSAAGVYTVHVLWNGRPVQGSPFHPKITDRSKVVLLDDLTDLKDENDHLALEYGKETVLNYNIGDAGPGTFSAEVLSPDGRLPVDIRNPDTDTVQVGFTAKVEGDHYIHLYWSSVPLDKSPILAYCPGPVLPINHARVIVSGEGATTARATVPVEFIVDGKKAGPGIPRVRLIGVRENVDIEMRAMKYDRYKCRYTARYPGGYLLHVYWSDLEIPGSPFKVTITTKGHIDKVTVTGQGLKGGYVGQELRAVVDTTDAGNGEISTECSGVRQMARCDQIDHRNGKYTLRIFPTEPCRHQLTVKYDGQHVPGSPFLIPVGEPPDPRKVRVYGTGVDPGVIHSFNSKFIVETYGAGAGQLAVRIRGPKGAFKVEMSREHDDERTILCRYNPEEPGEYIVHVKWSGVHVPGSPFVVPLFESFDAYRKYLHQHGDQIEPEPDYEWRDEI